MNKEQFIQKLTRKGSFLSLVDSHMHKEELVLPPVKGSFLRASTILDVCPREEFLCWKHNVSRSKTWSAKQKKTFMVGRAFEAAMRDTVVGNIGVLLGRWQCARCQVEGIDPRPRHPKPNHCYNCRHKDFIYLEEHVRNEEYGIEGHPDGFLEWQGKLYGLECKTVANYFYKTVLKQPIDSHYAQIQLYMHILGLKNWLIWYFNKETSSDLVHEVSYSPAYGAHIANKGLALKKAFESGVAPIGMCSSSDCERASKCVVANHCFN